MSVMSKTSCPDGLEEPWVGERPGSNQPDVQVGKQHPEQRDPGELHVLGVELGDLGPHPVPDWMLGEVLQPAASYVTAGVAGQRIQPQQGCVDDQNERAEAHVAPLAAVVTESKYCIPAQDQVEDQRDIEEVPVHVLQDQWEPALTSVLGVRLTDSAGGRRLPERPVVGLPVVVAGEPETHRAPDDQYCRGQPCDPRNPLEP